MSQVLPPEIVQLLFKTLTFYPCDLGKTYTNALVVCRQWYTLGLPIRWKDLAPNNFKSSRLCSTLAKQRPLRHFGLAGFLTINVPPDQYNDFNPHGHDDHKFRKLGSYLQVMQMLNTLLLDLRSINDNSVQRDCSHFGAWAWSLDIILSEMPSSNSHLETIVPGHAIPQYTSTCTHRKNFRYSNWPRAKLQVSRRSVAYLFREFGSWWPS